MGARVIHGDGFDGEPEKAVTQNETSSKHFPRIKRLFNLNRAGSPLILFGVSDG